MSHPYNKAYFDTYLVKDGVSGKFTGQKEPVYTFWTNFFDKYGVKSGRVLEVGCGLGFLGQLLAERYEYHGIDISDEAVEFARTKLNLANVEVGDANYLLFEDTTFDSVFCFDVVEHLANPDLFISEAYRVLKPGGLAIISTPNPNSLGNRLKNKEGPLVPAMYRDATHVSLFSLDEWKNRFETAGFQIFKSGTDSVWDLPYSNTIPLLLQKLVLVPFNRFFMRYIGYAGWGIGENCMLVVRKPML
jgi:2-polyprenyl-3-methyl-5-hydroxy-6-metoxy-1,4-benzoquinol methylase